VVWRVLFNALHQENVSGVKADTVGCSLEHWGMGSVILGVRRWSRVKDWADVGVRTVCIG
jgi:hypothetical protein